MSELSNGRSDRTLVWYLWMALAIAVHVALLDMVVETFISGAAARWWLVLAALAYAALLGYAFGAKKLPALLEPRAATIVGTLVGLGLILLTVTVPGGFDRGVAAFGAQTTAVLHAISALGVAVAGAALVLERRRPVAIPVLIGALAAYGTLAFVVALAAGDQYVPLFRGESFWRALPWWLQGAPVGALLLAMAVLVGIGSVLFRIPRYRLSSAVTATALAITLGVPTTALLRAQQPASPVSAGGPNGGGAEDPIEQDGTQRRPDISLDALFDSLAAVVALMSRDSFDPQAVVDRVGRDPAALADWVASNTSLVPYVGALRGPSGVLMDRTGNSLDRALLLHELLRLAGHDALLVRGALEDSAAQRLSTTVRVPDDVRAGDDVADDDAAADQQLASALAGSGIGIDEVDRAADEYVARYAEIESEGGRWASAQADTLVEKVVEHVNFADDATDAHAALTDHWWVRLPSRQLDLDPTLPVTSADRPQANATYQPSELPSELLHRVGVRVVLETLEQGALTEQTLVETDIVPAHAAAMGVILRHVPMDWPENDAETLARRQGEGLREILGSQRNWVPVLFTPQGAVTSKWFSDSGAVRDVSELSDNTTRLGRIVAEATSKVSSATSLFDDLLEEPDADDTAPAQAGVATAEWLEYTIRTPQASKVVRRQLFDLLGPARRAASQLDGAADSEDARLQRGLALLNESEILAVGGNLTSEYAQHSAASQVLRLRDALRTALSPSATDDEVAALRQPITGRTLPWVLARRQLAATPFTLVSPNVVVAHRGPAVGADGSLREMQAYDVVDNAIYVDAGRSRDAFASRLRQGVLDTIVEALLLPSCRAPSACSVMDASAAAFSKDSRTSAWRTVASVGDATPMVNNADTRQRVRQALASGAIAVVSAGNEPAAWWWNVDLADGTTLGIGDRGWGQEMVDYLLLFLDIAGAVTCMGELSIPEGSAVERAGSLACAASGYYGFIGGMAALGKEKSTEFRKLIIATLILERVFDGIDLATQIQR